MFASFSHYILQAQAWAGGWDKTLTVKMYPPRTILEYHIDTPPLKQPSLPTPVSSLNKIIKSYQTFISIYPMDKDLKKTNF